MILTTTDFAGKKLRRILGHTIEGNLGAEPVPDPLNISARGENFLTNFTNWHEEMYTAGVA